MVNDLRLGRDVLVHVPIFPDYPSQNPQYKGYTNIPPENCHQETVKTSILLPPESETNWGLTHIMFESCFNF